MSNNIIVTFILLSLSFCSFVSASNYNTDSISKNHGSINSLKNPNINTDEYESYLQKQNSLSKGLDNMTKVKTPSPLYDEKLTPQNQNTDINNLSSPNIKTKQYSTYLKNQNNLSRSLKNMAETKTPSPLYENNLPQDTQLPNYQNPPKLKAKDIKEYLKIQHASSNKLGNMTNTDHHSDNSISQNDNKLSNEFLTPPKLNPKDIQAYTKSQNESKNELNQINELGK
ncbi:MAG: hypothetical protein GY756_22915 [bacterium]|nr:hypothetical protein [bacterium]